MSGPDPPDVPTTRSLKRKSFSRDGQEELEELDRIFKRTKTVVPHNPYILSTPSMDPYRYHSQQEAHAWMLGHLWKPEEEHMQYRTYLYREPCQDCFELQAGEDDEPEPEPELEPERPRSRASPASNAASQAPKKKISLSAYKNKQANGVLTPTPGSKLASPSLPPTKPPTAHTNGTKPPDKQSVLAQKPLESKAQKHKSSIRHPLPPRPPAADAKSIEDEDSRPVDKSSPSNLTPHGLPPMISPVHEPLNNPYGLPDILSPTLPSSIQAELDRLEKHRSRAVSSASVSSTEPKSQTLAEGNHRPQVAGKTLKLEQRIRPASISGKSPYTAPPVTDEEKKKSKIVTLKFSKAKAATVERVLRLPPKRPAPPAEKKQSQDAPRESPVKIRTKVVEEPVQKKPKPIPKIAARRPETSTTSTSAHSTKPAAPATKTTEKRPRADDDASLAAPAKRQRALSSQDRPNTPTPQATSSPAPSAKSSMQKSQPQYETPKREHRAVNMLRTGSSESQEATPGRSGGTPANARPDARSAPTSAPLNGKKQAEIALMAQSSMKLNQMGRALKHEATKILMERGNKLTKQDEKRAAVTNLECILSYMAAYYAQDLSLNYRGRAGEVEQTWKTLLPLCLSYARFTKDFAHLDGLRSYLSSVIASTICTLISQRFSSTKPHDSPQDVARAQLARDHASLAENFALLADHTKKTTVHFQDARIALPVEDLQTQYKRTWAARETRTALIKEPEKISGARLSGPFFLPLASDTSPIQAVRFGLAFLHEYCEKEGLRYTLRVNLDQPS
ncbi:uncharacterized protein M421DRAFT_67110 [Didymella exigua CBS 183.55]|uniref:Uncharacterized protein n=1 Tax=Didymella exigua CBS 183.55 TaxID=1150837 RepID=A0A6A5RED6_9PLEO|nr:uncharacterized protein M421DRAFT_67110 [Didymella exigua CBS 183.55]KAF1926641.1 hypothetical protein M421DRAFT_67110 [Didymella exigua CBS 183.55]